MGAERDHELHTQKEKGTHFYNRVAAFRPAMQVFAESSADVHELLSQYTEEIRSSVSLM
jgi:hypothetical protein